MIYREGGGVSAVVSRVTKLEREKGTHILLGMRGRNRAWDG